MGTNEIKNGAIQAGLSYLLWGLLPIYWKFFGDIDSTEILANRIFWSFLFMVVILVIMRKQASFMAVLKGFRTHPKQMAALASASVLITINWFLFIWAVNSGQMIETSLGYYINPLISVLLGVIVLKEKLSAAQYVSFFLALVGVLIISFSYGRIPWIALSLALSFAIYGLAKKLIKVDAAIGLTLETMVMTPVAAVYLGYLVIEGSSVFLSNSLGVNLLLSAAGPATALPLLLFAGGAQRIPLSMLGFLQYIAPTLMLILGVLVYGEHFSGNQLLAFMFIWSALTVYSLSKTKLFTFLGLRLRKH